jgi:hypothetical protein
MLVWDGGPAFGVIDAPGDTGRVSVPDPSTGLTEANRPSDYPRISDDGLIVAFSSTATNLILGDANHRRDVFVHDRSTGATQLVSSASGGEQETETAANVSSGTGWT